MYDHLLVDKNWESYINVSNITNSENINISVSLWYETWGGGGAFVVAEKQSAICKDVPAFI